MPIEAKELLKLEYPALRAELLKRIELRQDLLKLALTVASALLVVAVTQSALALFATYSPIVFCFTLLWAQNDLRGRQIGQYIHDHIEAPSSGWEHHYRAELAGSTQLAGARLSIAAPFGTFLVLQALCCALVWLTPHVTSGAKALVAIESLAALLGTMWLGRHVSRGSRPTASPIIQNQAATPDVAGFHEEKDCP